MEPRRAEINVIEATSFLEGAVSMDMENSGENFINTKLLVEFAIDNEGALILLITSKNFVTVPKKTTQAVECNVPVNPASLINIQPLDEELLDGALPAVYCHKTQHKDKSLVIMYTNL